MHVAGDSRPLERLSLIRVCGRVRSSHVEAKVIIVELSTLPLHVVHGRQVAEGTELLTEVEHLICVGTVVTYFLATVVPLTQILLLSRLSVPVGLASLHRRVESHGSGRLTPLLISSFLN